MARQACWNQRGLSVMRRALAFSIVLKAALSASGASAETLKVAVAQRGFWNSSFIEFGIKQGFFKETGLDIDILYTEGGASTLTPVIAGSIDIAMTNGKLAIIAKASDAAAIANQTIRVNVANANALKERRDAITRFVKVLARSIDWAYSDDRSIETYAEMTKVPRALAQRTRDEFYPKASLQLTEVKGLDLTLKQALEFKYITAPMSVQDAQGMLDILYQPGAK